MVNFPIQENVRVTTRIQFSNIILRNNNNSEQRIIQHQHPRRFYSVFKNILYTEELNNLRLFFDQVKGSFGEFYYDDKSDNSATSTPLSLDTDTETYGQLYPAPDGFITTFQVIKTYRINQSYHYRPIINLSNLRLIQDNVEITSGFTNNNNGTITFIAPPGGNTIYCSFDFKVPVRLISDVLEDKIIARTNQDNYKLYALDNLEFIEIKPSLLIYPQDVINNNLQHELQIDFKWNQISKTEYKTEIQELGSGQENRKQRKINPEYFIDLGTRNDILLDEMQYLIALWLNTKGQGFYFNYDDAVSDNRYLSRFDNDELTYINQSSNNIFEVNNIKLKLFKDGIITDFDDLNLPTEELITLNGNFVGVDISDNPLNFESVYRYYPLKVKKTFISGFADDALLLEETGQNPPDGTLSSPSNYNTPVFLGYGKTTTVFVQQLVAFTPCYGRATIKFEIDSLEFDILTYAHLVKITTANNTIYAFTSHDKDLVINGVTYKANSAIQPTAYQSNSQLSLDSIQFDSVLIDFTEYDLFNNIEKGATIETGIVDWLDLPNTINESIDYQKGLIGEIESNGHYYKFEFLSKAASKLNQGYNDKLTSICRHRFGDSMCKYIPQEFIVSVNSLIGDTSRIIIDTPTDNGYLSKNHRFGIITFTSGELSGQVYSIDRIEDGANNESYVYLHNNILRLPLSSDTAIIKEGCLRTIAVCREYNNIENYGGIPVGGNWMPGSYEYIAPSIDRA